MQQISVARLFDGQNWQQNVTLTIEAGHIDSIQPAIGPVLSGSLVPGFIDVQVNGGGGALFNTDTSLEALRTMVKAHAQFGSTALLPTVITDSVVVMQQAATVIAQAIASEEPGIIGVHFEGPHLSVPKKGVHPQNFIRPLSEAELAIYKRTDLGIKLVTVAPETISPEQIKELVKADVIVCLGHSNADAATAQAALAAGATGFTHLYNAMSPLTSREPGVVGAALADPHSWCGVILDGLHVHPLAVKVALAAKPRGKLLIVTDAMSPVGTNQTEFDFFDGKVIRDGNKLTNLNGNLAGSVLDMAGAVSYAVKELGLELSEAVRMASLYPAEFLGISAERGQIKVGAKADLVLLNDNGLVQQCWLAGYPFMEQ
jgi:N-acetylglucosamine-6-phosphate deacetylase